MEAFKKSVHFLLLNIRCPMAAKNTTFTGSQNFHTCIYVKYQDNLSPAEYVSDIRSPRHIQFFRKALFGLKLSSYCNIGIIKRKKFKTSFSDKPWIHAFN